MHIYTNPPNGSEDMEEPVDVLRLKFAKASWIELCNMLRLYSSAPLICVLGLRRWPFESMMTRTVGAFACQLHEVEQFLLTYVLIRSASGMSGCARFLCAVAKCLTSRLSDRQG